jgi:putative transposase
VLSLLQMPKPNPFRYFKTSPEIIRLAVMMYIRFPLSLRNVEDLLHERGIDISHETVRFWWNRFGPMFAAEIRQPASKRMRSFTHWRWHLDEVFVKINGETRYLWRAVDHEGEVLEAFRLKAPGPQGGAEIPQETAETAWSCPKHSSPTGCGPTEPRCAIWGTRATAVSGRHLNNRAENAHLPFRRRERAMTRFRRMRSLQKFAAVHASIHNHFNQERHFTSRNNFKLNRAAALAEWRQLSLPEETFLTGYTHAGLVGLIAPNEGKTTTRDDHKCTGLSPTGPGSRCPDRTKADRGPTLKLDNSIGAGHSFASVFAPHSIRLVLVQI